MNSPYGTERRNQKPENTFASTNNYEIVLLYKCAFILSCYRALLATVCMFVYACVFALWCSPFSMEPETNNNNKHEEYLNCI